MFPVPACGPVLRGRSEAGPGGAEAYGLLFSPFVGTFPLLELLCVADTYLQEAQDRNLSARFPPDARKLFRIWSWASRAAHTVSINYRLQTGLLVGGWGGPHSLRSAYPDVNKANIAVVPSLLLPVSSLCSQ